MKITEVDLNIMSAPQSYYLAQGISKDLNFSTGLPALFDRMYDMREKLEIFYADPYTDEVCFRSEEHTSELQSQR